MYLLLDGLEYNKQYIVRVNLKEEIGRARRASLIFALNLRVQYIFIARQTVQIKIIINFIGLSD